MPSHCQEPNCTKRPTYGTPGTKVALYCAVHKRVDNVDIKNKRCQAAGCAKQPAYGAPGTKEALYCVAHKRADDIDVKNKRCQAAGCAKRPAYGTPGTKEALYCVAHKRADDVDVKNKRCQAAGCTKQPTYGVPGTKVAHYCVAHKRADDVDVMNKRCQAAGCTKHPAYGAPGTKEALYCLAHKRADDVNVVSKRCLSLGCVKRSVYGTPGTKEALYCMAHKRADDVNVVSKRCQAAGCVKQPVYGTPGTKEALYCVAHKRADDVDVKNKRCQTAGCAKQPVYGAPETKEALYCVTHKRADDVNVKIKRCLVPDCYTIARYGAPGTMPDRCHTHKEKGMIVYPRRRCENCRELGIWGRTAVAKERRCDAHRTPTDKNLIEGRCASCGLESVLDKAGTCLACGEAGKIKRCFLEKQRRVEAVLCDEFKIDSYDRVLDGGVCSRKRPDFVLDGTYRKIVVEVDEFQHRRGRSYGPDCEVRRMWDIVQALGSPTIFIRYNPDPYEDATGRRVDPVGSVREAALVSWIKTLQDREAPPSFASALYLYYDGFDRPETAVEEPLPDPFAAYQPPVMSDEAIDEMMSLFEVSLSVE